MSSSLRGNGFSGERRHAIVDRLGKLYIGRCLDNEERHILFLFADLNREIIPLIPEPYIASVCLSWTDL